MRKKGWIAVGLIVASILTGAAIHFYLFGYSYFSSQWVWAILAVRAVVALGIGFAARRFEMTAALSFVIFMGLECGPILMALWALFNFSETGRVGFSIAYWITPSVFDAALFLVGRLLKVELNR